MYPMEQNTAQRPGNYALPHLLCLCGTIAALCLPAALAAEDGGLADAVDCTSIHVDFDDSPTLSREERITRMNTAFYDALDQFDRCQALQQDGTARSGAGAGSGADGDSATPSGADTSDNALQAVDSVPAAGLRGTQPETSHTVGLARDTNGPRPAGGAPGPGARPEDIPEVANDDAIAAQIRIAAELEQDPARRERLWAEYRKYKQGSSPPPPPAAEDADLPEPPQ